MLCHLLENLLETVRQFDGSVELEGGEMKKRTSRYNVNCRETRDLCIGMDRKEPVTRGGWEGEVYMKKKQTYR